MRSRALRAVAALALTGLTANACYEVPDLSYALPDGGTGYPRDAAPAYDATTDAWWLDGSAGCLALCQATPIYGADGHSVSALAFDDANRLAIVALTNSLDTTSEIVSLSLDGTPKAFTTPLATAPWQVIAGVTTLARSKEVFALSLPAQAIVAVDTVAKTIGPIGGSDASAPIPMAALATQIDEGTTGTTGSVIAVTAATSAVVRIDTSDGLVTPIGRLTRSLRAGPFLAETDVFWFEETGASAAVASLYRTTLSAGPALLVPGSFRPVASATDGQLRFVTAGLEVVALQPPDFTRVTSFPNLPTAPAMFAVSRDGRRIAWLDAMGSRSVLKVLLPNGQVSTRTVRDPLSPYANATLWLTHIGWVDGRLYVVGGSNSGGTTWHVVYLHD